MKLNIKEVEINYWWTSAIASSTYSWEHLDRVIRTKNWKLKIYLKQ